MKKNMTKMLTWAAIGGVILYFLKGRSASGGNGGETVYLRASDGYGLTNVHKIQGNGVSATVGYDPDVYALKAGKTYQYTSNGPYSADLTTSWALWPQKPANTRPVALTMNGSNTGTATGVAFTFTLT